MRARSARVILVNWKNAPLTLRAAHSIAPQMGEGDHLVIVDNGSDDDSLIVLREGLDELRSAADPARVSLVNAGTNDGFGAGVMAGAAGLSEDALGSYTPPAGAAGANGPAGSSGVTGTTGANGGGAAGAAGAAGKGGTTSGGFMGAGASAGAGAGKDDKKGRKNRYVAFKFDDDEDELPAGYVNPLSQTSGTDKDIAPAKRMDDGWDPRQW